MRLDHFIPAVIAVFSLVGPANAEEQAGGAPPVFSGGSERVPGFAASSEVLPQSIGNRKPSSEVEPSGRSGSSRSSKFGRAGKFTLGTTVFALSGITFSSGLVSFTNINDDRAEEEDKRTSFGLSPKLGYFAVDNLELRLGLTYQSTSQDDNDLSVWLVVPELRYHIDIWKKTGSFPFVHFGYGIGYATSTRTVETSGNAMMEATTTTTESKTRLSDLVMGAGITQAFGKSQGGYISLATDYHMSKAEPETGDAEKYSGFDVNVSFGVFF